MDVFDDGLLCVCGDRLPRPLLCLWTANSIVSSGVHDHQTGISIGDGGFDDDVRGLHDACGVCGVCGLCGLCLCLCCSRDPVYGAFLDSDSARFSVLSSYQLDPEPQSPSPFPLEV